MPNSSLSEHFFHILIKAESQEVIILCKLHVVYLYLRITLTRVQRQCEITETLNELVEIIEFIRMNFSNVA